MNGTDHPQRDLEGAADKTLSFKERNAEMREMRRAKRFAKVQEKAWQTFEAVLANKQDLPKYLVDRYETAGEKMEKLEDNGVLKQKQCPDYRAVMKEMHAIFREAKKILFHNYTRSELVNLRATVNSSYLNRVARTDNLNDEPSKGGAAGVGEDDIGAGEGDVDSEGDDDTGTSTDESGGAAAGAEAGTRDGKRSTRSGEAGTEGSRDGKRATRGGAASGGSETGSTGSKQGSKKSSSDSATGDEGSPSSETGGEGSGGSTSTRAERGSTKKKEDKKDGEDDGAETADGARKKKEEGDGKDAEATGSMGGETLDTTVTDAIDTSRDEGGGLEGGAEDPAATEKARESAERQKLVDEAMSKLDGYMIEHRKTDEIMRTPTSGFTFEAETVALTTTEQELERLRTGLTTARDNEAPLKEIQDKVKALTDAIDTARPKLDDYEKLRTEAETVGKQRDDYFTELIPADHLANPEAYFAQLPAAFGPDLGPEAKMPKASYDALRKLEGEFNAATTPEAQRAKLAEITKQIEDDKKKLEDTKKVVDAFYNKDGKSIRTISDGYTIDFGSLSAGAADLQKTVAATPSAWTLSGRGFWGGVDQIRDNFYHARLFGAGNVPPLQFAEEQKAMEGANTELITAWKTFAEASTPQGRLEAIGKIRKATNDLRMAEEALNKKLEESITAVETAGVSLKDSYTGRVAGLFGGDLDEMSKSKWVENSDSGLGKTGRYLAQYTAGVGQAVEGLVKWGAGALVGIPLAVKTIPVAIYNGVTGEGTAARQELDNNTLTGTVTTLVWDGAFKNVIGTFARIVPGDSNFVTKWAFANQGGTNHFNEGMGALFGGMYDWLPWRDTPEAGNGYFLGNTVGLAATIVAGGAYSQGNLTAGIAGARPGQIATALREGVRFTGTRGAITAAPSTIAETVGRLSMRVRTLARPAAVPATLAEAAAGLEASAAAVGTVSATSTLAELNLVATPLIESLTSQLATFRASMTPAQIASADGALTALRTAAAGTDTGVLFAQLTAAATEASSLSTVLTALSLPGQAAAALSGAPLGTVNTAVTAANAIVDATVGMTGLTPAATALANSLEATLAALPNGLRAALRGATPGTTLEAELTQAIGELRSLSATTATDADALFARLRSATTLAESLSTQIGTLSLPLELTPLITELTALQTVEAALGTTAPTALSATSTYAEVNAIAARMSSSLRSAATRFATRDPFLAGEATRAATAIDTAVTATAGASDAAALLTALRTEGALAGRFTAETSALVLAAEGAAASSLVGGLTGIEGATTSGLLRGSSMPRLQSTGVDMVQQLRAGVQRLRAMNLRSTGDAQLLLDAEGVVNNLPRVLSNGNASVIISDLEVAGRVAGRMGTRLETFATEARLAAPAQRLAAQIRAAQGVLPGYITTPPGIPVLEAYARSMATQLRNVRTQVLAADPAATAVAADLEAAAVRLETAATAATATGAPTTAAADLLAEITAVDVATVVPTALVRLETLARLTPDVPLPAAPTALQRFITGVRSPRQTVNDAVIPVAGPGGVLAGVAGAGVVGTIDVGSSREEHTAAHRDIIPKSMSLEGKDVAKRKLDPATAFSETTANIVYAYFKDVVESADPVQDAAAAKAYWEKLMKNPTSLPSSLGKADSYQVVDGNFSFYDVNGNQLKFEGRDSLPAVPPTAE